MTTWVLYVFGLFCHVLTVQDQLGITKFKCGTQQQTVSQLQVEPPSIFQVESLRKLKPLTTQLFIKTLFILIYESIVAE